nr:MAG TPA: hypothetical protein [Bacteriophage sp.]
MKPGAWDEGRIQSDRFIKILQKATIQISNQTGSVTRNIVQGSYFK